MKYLLLATFVVVSSSLLGSIAFAAPTAQEACAYFANFAPIGTPNSGPIGAYGEETRGATIDGPTVLERYQSFTFEALTKIGTIQSDGKFYQTGSVSALVNCIVDIKDRRVVKIVVTAGSETGTIKANDSGFPSEVYGAESSVVDVGAQGHQGRF